MNNPSSYPQLHIFEKMLIAWSKVLLKHESVSVLNLTNREQIWRIMQLLKTPKLMKYFTPAHIITLDLSYLPIEEPEDFEAYLAKKRDKTKNTTFLFVLNADRLLTEKQYLLTYFNSLSHRNPSYSILFFFQKNIMLPQYIDRFSIFSTLYQNIMVYPLYDKKDQSLFIHYLQSKFRINLPSQISRAIIRECGGHLWLLKEVFRHYMHYQNIKTLFNHEELYLRLESLFTEMDEVEQNTLEKITLNLEISNKIEIKVIDYFLKTGLLQKYKDKYRITIPLLEEYIKKRLQQRTKLKLNEFKQITINGVLAESFFSQREKKFLKYCLLKNGILPRQKLGNLLWPTQTYSDWALDQFIRRLRKKFEKIGLSSSLITTIKNQGFVFTNI